MQIIKKYGKYKREKHPFFGEAANIQAIVQNIYHHKFDDRR
jgi:hypothetical protein